ncbi:serine/threonine protein kinase [Parahaliea maris]|uniref:Serine/threonine protein kinase n=1 Tax=Parahaliea maris TaxID=2716870 RepID=A0A5C9AAH1_9GAMM|nr:serine/threonine-protein kinase [Parahaliea maris]TXS96301.1 serine/threonine protein kinase [Parahaliea maris]
MARPQLSGPRIGPYRVLRLIRQGGQGSVYLGYDSRLQRRVAIKLYHLPAATRAERRKVVNEARIIAGIDSERVVKIHDVILAGDYLAMIMAYVPGIDLEELLQQGPPSLNALLNVGIDVAAALAAIRQQRIVHGDLKASNVLVSDNGRALLSDFGIARAPGRYPVVQGAASESALCPEHFSGEPLDVRSDLFALGSLLHRMVSGEHPFISEGKLDLQRLREGAPPALPDTLADGTPVPPGLRELVERLLQKRPGDRPDNTHRVRQILRQLAHEQPQAMQRMPLAGVRSDLRRESDDELPPALPQEFRQQGRSQLADWRGFDQLTRADLRKLLGTRRVQAGLGGLALAVALVATFIVPRAHRVDMAMPTVDVGQGVILPEGLSVQWLQEATCRAALVSNRHLRFYNAPPACPLAGEGVANNRQPPPAHEQLQIGLRCRGDICLLGLTRRGATNEHYRQVTLLPEMPLSRWQSLLEQLVETSFDAR